jgi:hypothetical protein
MFDQFAFRFAAADFLRLLDAALLIKVQGSLGLKLNKLIFLPKATRQ